MINAIREYFTYLFTYHHEGNDFDFILFLILYLPLVLLIINMFATEKMKKVAAIISGLICLTCFPVAPYLSKIFSLDMGTSFFDGVVILLGFLFIFISGLVASIIGYIVAAITRKKLNDKLRRNKVLAVIFVLIFIVWTIINVAVFAADYSPY